MATASGVGTANAATRAKLNPGEVRPDPAWSAPGDAPQAVLATAMYIAMAHRSAGCDLVQLQLERIAA